MSGTDHTPEHDEATQRAVRELLRTEPVDIDPDRRDAAIRAALDELDLHQDEDRSELPAPVPLHATHRGRRRAIPTWLAAAAAVLVVVAAGLVAVSLDEGSHEEGAQLAEASSTSAAAPDREESFAAEDSSDRLPETERNAWEQAEEGTVAGKPGVEPSPSSRGQAPSADELTGGGPAGAESTGALRDLGDFPDIASLLEATRSSRSGADDRASAFMDPAAHLSRCGPELAAEGLEPTALATVRNVPVVVAVSEGSDMVIELQGCTPIDR